MELVHGAEMGGGAQYEVPTEVLQVDGAAPEQAHAAYVAFRGWSEDSKRRLDAQVRAMRLLKTAESVPVSLMTAAGGRREHLTRHSDVDPTPPMDSLPQRMEWLRRASRESFWALPPHLIADVTAACSSSDVPGGWRRARTVSGERLWRAERRMREVQQEMDSQERDRAAAPATVSAHSGSTACAGAAAGSSSGHKGDTEGRIELLSLRLRSIQRRLRASVAEAHPLSGLPGPGSLRFIQREVDDFCAEDEESPKFWRVKKEEELRKRKVEAHARFLESVVSTHDSFRSHFKDRRELMKRLCKDIGKEFGKRERKKQALIDKEKKDRLLALKSNNFDAYRKQIQDSKNEKMKQMVKDMDRYMEKLGANINRQTAESAERVGKEMDQNAATEYTFHLPINEKITEQSSLVGGNDRTLKLKTYQIEGVNWLINLYNNNMSGILADEMGLGKTIQVIGMICYLVEHKNNNGPYLVIAPLSTISNWQSEFEKWAPTLTTYVYKGSPAERKRLFEDNMKDGNFNVLIVQFELVMDAKDAKRLKSLDWSHIIVDEGHRLKNRESKLFGVLTGKTGYRAKNRVILSGTPLQNEIHELWSLLNFLLPEIFETSDDFEEWFAKPFRTADDGADYDVVDEEKEFLIKCLHAVLRPFMTRRLKADLKDTMELPETREEIIWCELSALQKTLYLQTENHLLMRQGADGGASQTKIANRQAQLKKVCNHPFLFDEYKLGTGNEFLIRACGKLAILDRILPKLQRGGHRVLIYSQMVQLINKILVEYCCMRRYHYLVLTGETASEDRKTMMDKFNAPDSQYFIFMLSTRAGGQGINLQSADTVIIYDSDWNPMMDEQAKARVHRLGQTKQTLVLRLVTPNTVEEKVNKRAKARLENEDLAIEAGKFNQRTDVAESHEILKEKLKKEADIGEISAHAHTDEDINELIARTPEEIILFNQMDEDEKKEAEKRNRKSAQTPLPRLMADHEVPQWMQGDPIFIDDHVLILQDSTSADLGANDGHTGIVVSASSAENPLFVVKLDSTKEDVSIPRTRLRLMTHEDGVSYRQDLGFGRGQRVSREVERTDKVDFSKMTDKQFDKHMREADREEDENDAAKKKKKRKKEGEAGVRAGASPGEVGGVGRSPDNSQSKKKAKVGSEGKGGGGGGRPRSPDAGVGGNGVGSSISNGRHEQRTVGVAAPEERHPKYDPSARAPWKGGQVKPYLYGRKVVFKLSGRRLPEIWR